MWLSILWGQRPSLVATQHPPSGNGTASGGGDQFGQGANRIRDTAKWLVAGFGALGAALITSLQLSDLGHVSHAHYILALVGFSIGICGVLVAMIAAASILVAIRVSPDEILRKSYLRKYFARNSELLGGFPSLEILINSYRTLTQARVKAYSSMLSTYYGQPDPFVGDRPQDAIAGTSEGEANKKLYEFTEKQFTIINPAVTLALGAALFEKIRNRWVNWVLPGIVIGVLMAAAGAGLYATEAGAKSSPTTTSTSSHLEALIQLTPFGEHRLDGELGEHCNVTAMQVLVLERFASGWQFQTISDNCNSLIFNASNTDVVVEGELQPCPLPPSGSARPRPPPSAGSGPGAPIRVC
jgi:hypothetical protein